MTIQFLEGQNFRSYKDVRVDFVPTVNVIIGENDSGKTNLLRLINWIANNRPTGEDMRSNWGGDTVGRLGISNEELQVVERIRTNSDNEYRIQGQKDPLKAFGQGVPEIVQKILNLNSTNIHFQLEGPFLLNLKNATDVAKHYNDAVNLDIIDRSIKAISKTLWNEKNQLKKLKADQEQKEEKLEEFDWLSEAEKRLIELEKLQAKKLRLEKEYIELKTLSDQLKELKEKESELKEITKHEKTVNGLIELSNQIDAKNHEYIELEDLKNKLQGLQQRSGELQNVLKYEGKVVVLIELARQIEKLKSEYQELSDLRKKMVVLKSRDSQLSEMLKYKSGIDRLIELDKQISVKTDEYNELLDLTEKLNELQKQEQDLQDKIIKLQEEFKQELPDICPILEIECKHLKETRR